MTRRSTTTAGERGGKSRTGTRAPAPPPAPEPTTGGGIQPWHLGVVGVMIAAAAGAVATRDSGTIQTVSVVVMILTAGLVAAGLVRTFAPLAAADVGEQTDMVAGRTRAALEREKMLVLRSIKEVEFDRAMRKISEADYNEVVPRLRARAVGLIRQLEGGGGYRALIERDLAAVVSSAAGAGALGARTAAAEAPQAVSAPAPVSPAAGTCQECATENDKDARFCKSCGARLAGGV